MIGENSRERLNVILSVDWEPDHGPWKWQGTQIDYGGVLKGTAAFCGLLDELRIPATWFIETSYDSTRDLPVLFPNLLGQLVSREQDEIGLHIHWRKSNADDSISYETSDGQWVAAQIEHGIRQLNSVGACPRAFRSGGLLHVPQLPRILDKRGFLVDSSTLWGKANRRRRPHGHFETKSIGARVSSLLRRTLAPIPQPYLTEYQDVELKGDSPIVEFPITYSLFETKALAQATLCRFLKYKALLAKQNRYLMLFFHIDELTDCLSGPDEQTKLSPAIISHFRKHLKGLQDSGARFLTCSEARTHWLGDAVVEAGRAVSTARSS